MFYVKESISEDIAIRIEITDENVFTRCIKCGKEIPVDLEELIAEHECDLYGTSLLCGDCTKMQDK